MAGVALLLLAPGRAAAAGPGADPALREARLDELACDREGAARMYATWLAANAGSLRAPWAFARYFTLEQDFPALAEAGKKFLGSAGEVTGHGALFGRIARFFEVAGMSEEARDAYLAAFEHGDGPADLEAAFLLSLEMNDVESMAKSLAAVKRAGSSTTAFLDACLAYQKGDSAPAREALKRIAEDSQDPDEVLKALWVSYSIAIRLNDAKAAAAAAEKLGVRFPQSPEYAMTVPAKEKQPQRTTARVVPLPVPGGFFSEPPGAPPNVQPDAQTPSFDLPAPEPPPEQPASASAQGEPPGAAVTLSVQAGSFQMKENADDLVSELTRSGFTPTVRTETFQGRQLYRVYAGSLLTGDDARALLDSLHAAGFSGFLVKGTKDE